MVDAAFLINRASFICDSISANWIFGEINFLHVPVGRKISFFYFFQFSRWRRENQTIESLLIGLKPNEVEVIIHYLWINPIFSYLEHAKTVRNFSKNITSYRSLCNLTRNKKYKTINIINKLKAIQQLAMPIIVDYWRKSHAISRIEQLPLNYRQ